MDEESRNKARAQRPSVAFETDEEIIRKSTNAVNIGLRKIREGKMNAGGDFWHALLCLDDLEDPRKRREELSLISIFFNEWGFYDMSLIAIQNALELDVTLGDHRSLAKDMITHGNINMNLGNSYLAAVIYSKAIEDCLGNNDFANAASASTNLADIIAREGKMLEAVTLLKKSLQYLEKAPFAETEITTRLLLINVLDVEKIQPLTVIENAEVLFNRYADKIREDQKRMAVDALKSAIQRYLRDHPELESRSWKQQKFPWLINGESGDQS